MASGWVKSLQCKSKAFEDVYHPNPKISIPSASCRKSVHNIKDVIDTSKPKPKPKPKPRNLERHPSSTYPRANKPEPSSSNPKSMTRSRSSVPTRPRLDPFLPSLTELHEGHPSRNVVEIIFHTSWGPKPFSGRIEMIFKVVNASKTVSRFEEYREAVKGRVSSGAPTDENARCVADGNEVMRFQCLGPYDAAGGGGGGGWSLAGVKGSVNRTFSGSGEAHENGGGGRGRRAMMVCRVIAGRVSKQIGFMDSLLDGRVGLDSVSGDNGELFVFDSRAVLPCFLIIYRV